MTEFISWWAHLTCSEAMAIILTGALLLWTAVYGVVTYRRVTREMDRHDLARRVRRGQPPAFTCKRRY